MGELDTEGYIRRQRKGRLNVYRVNRGVPARNVQSRVPVGGLLTVISSSGHGIMGEVTTPDRKNRRVSFGAV